jgi:hypothetical protein
MKETAIREWTATPEHGLTPVCLRTASGKWMTGVKFATGNWWGGGEDVRYATDEQAMEWFERWFCRWGLPDGAREHFPSEMVD